MGLFKLLEWLGLVLPKPDATRDVSERLERMADRFVHSGDANAARIARSAAGRARQARNAEMARKIEAEVLNTLGLRADGRPIKPVLGQGPGNTRFVRQGRFVRSGGSRAWRYNNPGYVRCSPRSSSYGAIGCDGEFAIFPDTHTGVRALHQTLRDEYPGQPLNEALRQHLPPESDLDPDRFCEEAGLREGARVEELSLDSIPNIESSLMKQSAWEEGELFDRTEVDNPEWVESTWTDTGGIADDNAGDVGDATPTDDS